MSRKLRETVANVRSEATVIDDRLKNALSFVSKFSGVAANFPTVEEALSSLGYLSESGFDSETSSFSFAMNEGTAASFAASSRSGKFNFCSDLAHRSWLVDDGSGKTEDDNFVPWIGQASIMFVDLSGYSKITSYLSSRGGAHALSAAVNSFFEAILDIVCDKYGGDVISFAGDAICVCWPCVEMSEQDACVLACACANELQRKCGISPVQGTDLAFRLHIGITFGEIESQVLKCRQSANMQAAYHFVQGEPLTETAIVVDAAKVGETCVTKTVHGYFNEFGEMQKRVVDNEVVFVLGQLDDELDERISRVTSPLPPERSLWLEKNLVPPLVTRKLRQGFKTAHLAEMRFLCVLFIRKQLETVSTLEWFTEVQQVLDECRCPIVQLLHDDKGTHLIACVNLFRTERDPTSNALRAARTLVNRETGCVIGVACGQVFCGVTGAEQAGRWDVTGPACVRACRLMQHGVASNIDVVLDESIYANVEDVSQLEKVDEPIELKGSSDPVPIFVLSKETREVTAGILATTWASPTLYLQQRERLRSEVLATKIQRGVVLVSGPIGVGKKTALLITLAAESFASVVHFASTETRPLCVLDTLADWFSSYHNKRVSSLGDQLKVALTGEKLTKALSVFHRIVDLVIADGIKFCYIIAYATLMEPASLGMIKSFLGSKPSVGEGRFIFALTAYPLYRTRSISSLETEISRQAQENIRQSRRLNENQQDLVQKKCVHIELSYAKNAGEFAEAFAGTSYFHLKPMAAEVLLEATGGCLLFVKPILDYMSTVTFSLHNDNVESKHHLFPASIDGTIDVTNAGEDFFMREISWPQVAPVATARFTELYDVLSPRLQLVLRLAASLSTTTGSANPYHIVAVMTKLNTKVSEELIHSDIKELISLQILKELALDGGEVCFAVPAMIDVVMGLLTPDQDRMLKRHAFKLTNEFIEREGIEVIERSHQPIFYSFVARLAMAAGDVGTYKKKLATSWKICLEVNAESPNQDLVERMQERLSTENRRNPTYCNSELFAESPTKPLLENYIRPTKMQKALPSLPHLMRFFGGGFLPPMALGSISGEYQKLGWACLNYWLDFTKEPNRVFLPEHLRSFLHVNLDAYMAAIERFETVIPQISSEILKSLSASEEPSDAATLEAFGCVLPLSLQEERVILERAQSKPATVGEAEQHCNILLHYYYKVLLPRRCRIIHYVRSLQKMADVQCTEMRQDETAVGRAFRRFLRPYPIPSTVVHEALLDLATDGWQPRYFHVSLQLIRQLIFKARTATADDFKAFLLATKMFGEEITAAIKSL